MSSRRIILIASILSLLISLITSYSSIINPDGICYLLSAEDMQSGINHAMHLCEQAKWPFYSFLIYALANLTALKFQTAAFILNGFFSLISVLTFIFIQKHLNPHLKTILFASFVILAAHQFNSFRGDIIRDHGFWAFYLISILYLLRFMRNASWQNAAVWNISLVLATLFRIEGAVFLIFMPLIVFFNTEENFLIRTKSFIKLNIITLTASILVIAFLLTHPHLQIRRVNELLLQFTHGFTLLYTHFHENLMLPLIGLYLGNLVATVSPIFAILIMYAWIKKIVPDEKRDHLVLIGYILLNIAITCIFLIENSFLSKRYLMALALVLMLYIPNCLVYFYEIRHFKKWPLIASLFLITIFGLSGIFNVGYSKNYIYDAGQWVQHNIDQSKTLYANDYQLMFYTNRFGNKIFNQYEHYQKLPKNQLQQFDYLALRVNGLPRTKMSLPENFKSLNKFQNSRGDAVIILKRGT